MNNLTGRFISFEGTEGVGKTTAINNLCQKLEDAGIEYVHTREPGGSDFAEKLRDILLSPATQINEDTELLLIFAARSDHLANVILPALKAGKWVICDRFVDSSFAYQGFGRSSDNENHAIAMQAKVKQLTADFVEKMPDLTLWLDLPVKEGIERAGKRSAADRFEQEAVDFFERVHQGYQYLAKNEPERFKRISASGTAEQVAKRIWQAVNENV
ncbi:dTMP kinase [Psychrobacter sp. HD31]|uniref:dTMP kinase n=1 Tax=Psychrobacter sp. HD31 TaxID=3112003 RepID=UPI003DA29055